MGWLEDYIDDPNVTDIYVNGPCSVQLRRRDGTAVEADPIADSDEELIDMIQALARRQPRRRR